MLKSSDPPRVCRDFQNDICVGMALDEATAALLAQFREEHFQARRAKGAPAAWLARAPEPSAPARLALAPEPSEWTCASCTLKNTPLALMCNLCCAQRPHEGAPSPPGLVGVALRVRAPAGAECVSCGEAAEYNSCNCPPPPASGGGGSGGGGGGGGGGGVCPHPLCGSCFVDATRAQLATATLFCPFAPAPEAGAAEKGFQHSMINEEVVTFLAEHPSAAGGRLTPAEMGRVTQLGIVNAARLGGQLSHTCPRAECPGIFYGDPPPPLGAPGEPMACSIGKRAGSTSAPCPAIFCAICGETWDPLHKGKACGRWREEAPPPEGMRPCPWCNVPSEHCFVRCPFFRARARHPAPAPPPRPFSDALFFLCPDRTTAAITLCVQTLRAGSSTAGCA